MTTDAPRDWREEARALRHELDEAHIGRVVRAAAAGLSPADFARRATADAWELHTAARAAVARPDAPRHPRFGLRETAEARGWDDDRAQAAMRRADALDLFRVERYHVDDPAWPTFTLDILTGGRCETCGHPRTAIMPRRVEAEPDLFSQAADDDDQEQDGPCLRCWRNPHELEDRKALLERVGAEWVAYRTRPSQKANGKYDEGGHHAYMRYAFHACGIRSDDGRHPFEQPADWPRCYSHRDRDWHERRALAALIRDGFVGMVDDPDRRANCLRATFGVTPAGARLLRLDLDSLPAPVCGPLRDHRPRGRATGETCACGHREGEHSPTQGYCLRCECPSPTRPMPEPTRADRARALTEELRAERAAATPATPADAPAPAGAAALTLF